MFFICFFILRIELRTLSILDKCSTNWPTSQRPHHYVFFFLVYSDTVSHSVNKTSHRRHQAPLSLESMSLASLTSFT